MYCTLKVQFSRKIFISTDTSSNLTESCHWFDVKARNNWKFKNKQLHRVELPLIY